MSYATIDEALSGWARENQLHLYTHYRDVEVRSVEIVSRHGDRFQIWVDSPQDDTVWVRAWDYKRRRMNLESTTANLRIALDATHKAVRTWMSELDDDLRCGGRVRHARTKTGCSTIVAAELGNEPL